jgi:hypothetical protein
MGGGDGRVEVEDSGCEEGEYPWGLGGHFNSVQVLGCAAIIFYVCNYSKKCHISSSKVYFSLFDVRPYPLVDRLHPPDQLRIEKRGGGGH